MAQKADGNVLWKQACLLGSCHSLKNAFVIHSLQRYGQNFWQNSCTISTTLSDLSTLLYRSEFKHFEWVGSGNRFSAFLTTPEMVCISALVENCFKYSSGLVTNLTYTTYSCESGAISLLSGKLQSSDPTVN